jgi:protein-S-isoprenylcysteine O-methyltransferase Ste14
MSASDTSSRRGDLAGRDAGGTVGAGSPAQDIVSASRGVSLGAWFFKQRSWTPVPLALLLVAARWNAVHDRRLLIAGEIVVLSGLAIRMWAVRHIGGISRTRAARLGPLTITGPYLLVRNPLYVGNLLIWIGFTLASQLLWMLPVGLAFFALQYGAVTRYEEAALLRSYGDDYRGYVRTVPRWAPRLSALGSACRSRGHFGWGAVVFSERGTLIAALILTLLMLARYAWWL